MGALCRVRGLNDVYISQVALNQVEAFSDVGQHSHAGIVEHLRHVGDCFDYFFFIELSAIIFATAAIILQLFFFSSGAPTFDLSGISLFAISRVEIAATHSFVLPSIWLRLYRY